MISLLLLRRTQKIPIYSTYCIRMVLSVFLFQRYFFNLSAQREYLYRLILLYSLFGCHVVMQDAVRPSPFLIQRVIRKMRSKREYLS